MSKIYEKNELSEALGLGRDLRLGEQTLHLDPLDFADLADLEEAMTAEPRSAQEEAVIEALRASKAPGAEEYRNPLSRLRPFSLAHQLILMHLCLRKSRPGITRAQTAALISARQFQKPETTEFLSEMLLISGVMGGSEDAETREPEAADPEGDPTPKKSRTRRASTSD